MHTTSSDKGVFFFLYYLPTSTTTWAQIFTGLLFCSLVEKHQVRRLVLDNYQYCPVSLITIFQQKSEKKNEHHACKERLSQLTLHIYCFCGGWPALKVFDLDNEGALPRKLFRASAPLKLFLNISILASRSTEYWPLSRGPRGELAWDEDGYKEWLWLDWSSLMLTAIVVRLRWRLMKELSNEEDLNLLTQNNNKNNSTNLYSAKSIKNNAPWRLQGNIQQGITISSKSAKNHKINMSSNYRNKQYTMEKYNRNELKSPEA